MGDFIFAVVNGVVITGFFWLILRPLLRALEQLREERDRLREKAEEYRKEANEAMRLMHDHCEAKQLYRKDRDKFKEAYEATSNRLELLEVACETWRAQSKASKKYAEELRLFVEDLVDRTRNMPGPTVTDHADVEDLDEDLDEDLEDDQDDDWDDDDDEDYLENLGDDLQVVSE